MDTRKRSRTEATANGGLKKSRPEMDLLSSGIGSKSKPCTKFFSTAGCPFGEECHFLHHFPGGYNAVAQMMNMGPPPTVPPPNGAGPTAVKTKICNKYSSPEGCKFGDKCHFAHGEWELGRGIAPSHDVMGPGPMGPGPGPVPVPGPRFGRPVPGPAPASFGLSATTKISVDASLAGAIIGKKGANSRHICMQTGAKLAIKEHESDPNLRNIELEGTFEQIQEASGMVTELIASLRSMGGPGRNHGMGMPPVGAGGAPPPQMNNYKTKPCENFAKGTCTFGERCHFAHGTAELRKASGI